jgi:HlyD family secretion protein
MTNTHTTRKILLGLLVLLIIVLLFLRSGTKTKSDEVTPFSQRIAKVTLLDSSVQKGSGARISTIGEVEALAEAELQAQVSERVSGVFASIGQRVSAGTTLVTLENASLQANVNVAQANLQAAQARLAELESGARPQELAIAQTNVNNAETALKNAQQTLRNTLINTYTTADDAIRTKTDILFTNPRSQAPWLVFDTNDFQRDIDVRNSRIVIEEMLTTWEAMKNNEEMLLSDEHIAHAESTLSAINSYLDELSILVTDLTANRELSSATIEGWKANISVARSAIVGSKASLTGSLEKLSGAQNALVLAQEQQNLTQSGSTIEQLNAQKSQVAAAQAQVDSAQLQLAKTIITSPISGVVSVLSVDTGDLVSPGTRIASVVNPNGLSVTTYISSDDVSLITVGSRAIINDTYNATVTRIAPSINPDTKKIEVTVALSTSNTSLVIGEFVDVKIDTAGQEGILPLQVVETNATGSYVYTVSDENRVVAHQIQLGRVIGEYVQVKEGLEGISNIISVARGVSEGDLVEVTN